MKKVIAIVLALLMVFALASCGKKTITLYYPYDETSLTALNATVMRDWLEEQLGKDYKVEVEYNKTASGWNLAEKMLNAKADGTKFMIIGLDALTGYVKGDWKQSPADPNQFTIVTGFTQPYPYSGCMLITQAGSPYSNWAELEAYAKAHPREVNVADRAGSIMTTKLKSLFKQTGLYDYVNWTPATSDSVKTGITNGQINIAIFDETSAVKYLKDTANYKAIINCRADNNFDYYDQNLDGLNLIKAVPTLKDVFPAKADQYNVPNTTAVICKAGTPADVVAAMKKAMDALGDVPASTDENSFYVRQRVNGGTSKYYTWPSEDILKEWQRLLPVIEQIEKN